MTEAITPLNVQAYSRIASSIRNGELAPAMKLPIRALSERFSVGLMPAREAVQRLAAEQGLTLVANRTISVPVFSAADFEDLISAAILAERLVVEGIFRLDHCDIVRQSLHRLSLPDFSTITFESYRYWLANDFQRLFALTPNKFALRCMETIAVRLGPLFYSMAPLDSHIERYFCQYHGHLITDYIESISRCDGDAAMLLIAKRRKFERYFVSEHLANNLQSNDGSTRGTI